MREPDACLLDFGDVRVKEDGAVKIYDPGILIKNYLKEDVESAAPSVLAIEL